MLWRGLGGKSRDLWAAFLLMLTFVPTAFLIAEGQITSIVLFGLAGFVWALRAERPLLAGMLGALTGVKPHLLLLFGLWVFCEACRSRFGRRVLLGGLITGAAGCLLTTLLNSGLWLDYWQVLSTPSSASHHHLSYWNPPLAGRWLRQLVPGTPFWAQWLPLAFGVVAYMTWEFRFRDRERDDADYLPGLVGFSLLIAPYGAWQHDLVLLLVPVYAAAIEVAARRGRDARVLGAIVLVLVIGVMLGMLLARALPQWYVWVVPTVLAGCHAVMNLAVSERQGMSTTLPNTVEAGVLVATGNR
jgi:hypothetical protein